MIYWLLFWEFAQISVVCVGGGYASMPLIQSIVVEEYHWLTLSEFIDIFTISQMTPGPIGVNAATFAGMKIAGLPGAVSATMGFVTPSLFLCVMIARLFMKYGELDSIRGVLNGLRPAVIALIAAATISFILLAVWNTEEWPKDVLGEMDWTGLVILFLALAAVRRKVDVLKVLTGCGFLGLLLGFLK